MRDPDKRFRDRMMSEGHTAESVQAGPDLLPIGVRIRQSAGNRPLQDPEPGHPQHIGDPAGVRAATSGMISRSAFSRKSSIWG